MMQKTTNENGVAIGSPLVPLVANAFLCSIEEQRERKNKLPSLYRRYVDDTLSSVPDIQSATTFLATLNECHPCIYFTMEIADSNKEQFLGTMIERKGCELVASVYRKPTNNGLLLHFQSHVDMHYKKSLIKTMLSGLPPFIFLESVVRECDYLKGMFFKLGYPNRPVDATVTSFLNSVFVEKDQVQKNNAMWEGNIVRVILPLSWNTWHAWPIIVATFLRWICSTSSTVNIGLNVDSTCMFGSYPLKKYYLVEFVTRIKC